MFFSVGGVLMFITDLELKNFRNYDQLKLEFSPEINIIYGQNAQGKTNLLEAVSLLCLGRSFRTKKDIELIKWNEPFCFLKGNFEGEGLTNMIEIGMGNGQKKIKLNGNPIRSSDLFSKIPIVSFAPDDLQLVKGGPQLRRDFLDLYLAQIEPGYRYTYVDFYKILQQRNRFLKIGFDSAEYEVWNEQLVKTGVKVIRHRAILIEQIKPYIIAAHRRISSAQETLTLEYQSLNTKNLYLMDEAEIKALFEAELKRVKSAEFERKQTLVGPQRDELLLTLNGDVELRNYGSQGQQRTVSLALKLGMIDILTVQRGTSPILLLDDVMSEFDDHRKQALLELLSGISQTFLTSTAKRDFPLAERLQTVFYKVEGGKINYGG